MTQKPDESAVKKFYNETPEIWASYDRWHLWSRQQIQKYLDSVAFPSESDILNAGSGGNDYGIICKKMIHVDIADQKLKDIPNSVVASIESLPFQSNTFDGIVCVCPRKRAATIRLTKFGTVTDLRSGQQDVVS